MDTDIEHFFSWQVGIQQPVMRKALLLLSYLRHS